MKYLLPREDAHTFRRLMLELSGEDVASCSQCGKCTAGCPIALEMDLQPNQVMRLIQINFKERVLGSSTIWLCVSCQTCTTRCPEGIDIANVIDVLRKLSVEEGISPPQPAISTFNRVFLESVRKYGRVHELDLVLRYNLASGQPLRDVDLGLKLFRRGKIGLLAQKIKGIAQVKGLFSRSKRFLFKGLAGA